MESSLRRKWYVGFGLILLVIMAFMAWEKHILVFLGFMVFLSIVALYDFFQTKHSILRNFPVLGHMRYILEFFRPEIQQYFIAQETDEKPFDRQTRDLVYQRAKGLDDTLGFGSDRNINEVGYEWVVHSLAPKHPKDVKQRIMVGNDQCLQPYSASRLNVSAMSFGAISKNAIIALNKAAKLGNFSHNTGEGGLTKYHLSGEGDLVLQIGTAYFGFRKPDGSFDPEKFKIQANLPSVKMIEIKLSQGAKPAHGGVLPAKKVTPEIAEIRGVNLGEDVLSPPAHTTFSTPIEFCQWIKELRELANGKPIGFKLCLGRKREFFSICKAILKTGICPDFITVDGAEGGTGAAPAEYINYIGVPLEPALIFVHNALVGCGLREKIRIIASGKIVTGFDMVKYISLGADIINSARGMMLALGCIQSKQCNRNTCPVGVATQNPKLYRALHVEDKKERVRRFHDATLKSFTEIVGAMGFTEPCELGPESIYRRVSNEKTKRFNEIHLYVEKGIFLTDQPIPEEYKLFWETAKTEAFH